MKMKVICVIFFFSLTLLVNAQKTYEIDYSNVYQSQSCNVFASPATISGLTHQTMFGTPRYGVIANSCAEYDCVSLFNSSVFTSTSGDLKLYSSGYSVAFNFKQGCHYKISVLGRTKFFGSWGGKYSNVGLAISSTNGGTSTSCSPPFILYSTVSSYPTGLLDTYTCSGDYKWVTPISADLTADANYLLVAGLPDGNSGDTYVCIKKIIIEETPKIAPSSVEIGCGSTTPVTFTVANGNNSGAVTGYTWDLGSTNNGWLYNSTPAPQTINTVGNSIQLTPICGTPKNNVSASVNVSGTTLPAGVSTITNSLTGLSISGSYGIANTETYTIPNLPCNASVVWSVTPSGIVNSNCSNCSQVDLTRITDGNITLSAQVTACGITSTLSKNIAVCNPPNSIPSNLTASLTWPTSYYYGYNLYFTTVPSATSYRLEWFDVTDNVLLNTFEIYNSGDLYYYFTAGHTYKYRLAANLNCGTMGSFSSWSSDLLPPPASCTTGPLSSTLTQTLGCGGSSSCPMTNISWPSVPGASQYQVDYRVHNISAGLTAASGTITTPNPNSVVYYGVLSGTGWTITYRVAANCGSGFGNYSGWSSNFFLQ